VSRQTAFWSGEGGDAYVERNRIQWAARVPFWSALLAKHGAGDILEVGCGSAWNLLAIRSLKEHPWRLCGAEINDKAIAEAREANVTVDKCAAIDVLKHYGPRQFDLVFTAGLLIHVPPAEILCVMSQIKQVSRRFVLAIEYSDHREVEVTYRGEKDLLWRRPYGYLYEAMDLYPVEEGEAESFDRCHFWLLEHR